MMFGESSRMLSCGPAPWTTMGYRPTRLRNVRDKLSRTITWIGFEKAGRSSRQLYVLVLRVEWQYRELNRYE